MVALLIFKCLFIQTDLNTLAFIYFFQTTQIYWEVKKNNHSVAYNQLFQMFRERTYVNIPKVWHFKG